MTRTNGLVVCAVAAVCFAAASSIAFAQESQLRGVHLQSWDETLKNTISYAWNTARNTARIATLNAVTINMCWASDKNDLVRDPAVVEGFQKIRGNEKVTINFPRDSSGTLLGSGDIMTR